MKKSRVAGMTLLPFGFLLLSSMIIAACQQNIQPPALQTGNVRIVLAGSSTRSVDAAGLPVFDLSNTKITVTEAETNKELTATREEGSAALTLTLPVDTKITIKAAVTTAVGRWRGSKDHTVTSGLNTVTLKLSKAPQGVANLLFSAKDGKAVLKLDGVSEKLAEITLAASGQHPTLITARDGIGRIYAVDYKDAAAPAIRRFTAEGKEDTSFNERLSSVLTGLQPVSLAADTKNNVLFVFTGSTECIAVREENGTITKSDTCNIKTFDPSVEKVHAAAAYNGTLFAAVTVQSSIGGTPHVPELAVRAYTVSMFGTSLALTAAGSIVVPALVAESSESDGLQCTDMTADAAGVYCLLSQKKTGESGLLYAVGKLIQYAYTGNAFTVQYEAGLNPQTIRYGGIGFAENALSYPAAFIGYDEESISIADDGIDIGSDEYIDWHIGGNKNRIAVFNRTDGTLAFEPVGADGTWNTEYEKYPAAKAPSLLWEKQSSGSVTLKLQTGSSTPKMLVENINTMQQPKLMTARDSTGSVYVLYYDNESPAKLHLERFLADGTKDEDFEPAKTGFVLPDPDVTELAVDLKTADLFLLKRTAHSGKTVITAFRAKPENSYASFSSPVAVDIPDKSGYTSIDSVAAFDGTLFFAMDVKPENDVKKMLYAYKIQTTGSFAFTGTHTEAVLPKLRTGEAYKDHKTVCTGLFADRQGVYALLTQQSIDSAASLYALGQIQRYSYDGAAALTPVTLPDNGGCAPAAASSSRAFDERYFSNPAGFIGYDGNSLSIADDGIIINEVRENFRITGNSNRILTFNRKDNSIADTASAAPTWFGEQQPSDKLTVSTPVLLWQKGDGSSYHGMRYWSSENGTDTLPGDQSLIYESNVSAIPISDVFCYDQDGNLYILWSYGTDYYIKRFEPDEHSYQFTAGKILKIGVLPSKPVAIAVDISGGKNYLYCGYQDGNLSKIARWIWDAFSYTTTSATHNEMPKDNAYTIIVTPEGTETSVLTSLVANKDGVFAGVRHVDINPAQYRLSVRKYKKESGSLDGEVAVGTKQVIPEKKPETLLQPYDKTEETINDLQIMDGVLYGIVEKEEITEQPAGSPPQYKMEKFKNSSILCKIGTTASFSGTAEPLAEQKAVDEVGKQTGYGFYRFIAVKPDRFVIASNGAWGTDGTKTGGGTLHNTDKVLEYDLQGNLKAEVFAAGTFSRELRNGVDAFIFE